MSEPLSTYVEYFNTLSLISFWRNGFGMSLLLPADTPPDDRLRSIEQDVQSFDDLAAPLTLNHDELKKLVRRAITARMRRRGKTHESWRTMILREGSAKSRRKPDSVLQFLHKHIELMAAKLRAVPNGAEKGDTALHGLVDSNLFLRNEQSCDVLTYFGPDAPVAAVQSIVSQWKDERRRREEERRALPSGTSSIFWSSSTYYAEVDAVSRYAFRTRFSIPGFDDAFQEVETWLSNTVVQEPLGHVRMLSYTLWAISRCPALVAKLSNAIELALRNVHDARGGSYWTETIADQSGVRDEPSIATTAYCSCVTLRLATSDAQRRRAIEGAKWLIEQQLDEGAWEIDVYRGAAVRRTPDLFTTLLSADAIVRAEITGAQPIIARAFEWVLKQQTVTGLWDRDDMPAEIATVHVLETLTNTARRQALSTRAFLDMSASFLKRAVRFVSEDSINSLRLAIIVTHHGLEFLLYELLDANNVAFIDSKGTTLGFRDALRAYQLKLQQDKRIKASETLQFRNSLNRLAHIRDEVIHKGADVAKHTAEPLIDDALKFASIYSTLQFGFNYLE